jgi:outer membrane protein assembly factor BamA
MTGKLRQGSMKIYQSKRLITFLVPAFLILSIAFNVSAQQSRAEEIAAIKADKAKVLKPYEPNKVEQWIARLRGLGFVGPAPQGLYPWLGSVYSGGGFSAGLGFRQPFTETGFWDIHGGWSISNYKLVSTKLHLPELANRSIHLEVDASYIDATKVRFFGIGNDSLEENETNFQYQPTRVGLTGTVYAARWFYFGGGFDYLDITTSSGDGSTPSIEEEFTPFDTPGLGADLTYNLYHGFAALDARQSPGYNTSGAILRGDWYKYDEQDGLPFSFEQFDIIGAAYIPLLRANWVILLAGRVSTTNTDGDDEVPHFLLPKLGGGRELRGYPDYRFQDRHKLVMTAEYRWTPSKFVDMALFYDLGKVASRRSDLDFEDLHDSYGIGIRFHTPLATVFRFDVAFSDENKPRLIFAFSPSY